MISCGPTFITVFAIPVITSLADVIMPASSVNPAPVIFFVFVFVFKKNLAKLIVEAYLQTSIFTRFFSIIKN
nr:MAG TPA: hypothetical protein [Inoviridae sp.]